MDYPNEIVFDVLKSRSVVEKFSVIFFLGLFSFCIYAVVQLMEYLNSDNESIVYFLMLPVIYIYTLSF
jgi:uncharacterized membrane protein